MPNFDKTGPQGKGPMTGRGLGYCAGHNPGDEDNRPSFGRGYGRGRRRRRGCGRGLGRGMGRGPAANNDLDSAEKTA